MRILLTVGSVAPECGGPSLSVCRLASALANAGHEVGVWAADGSAADSKILNDVEHDGTLFRRLVGDIESVFADFGQPNIVHDNGVWHQSNHSVASIARRRGGIARVVSPHGMLEPWAYNYKPIKKRLASLVPTRLLRSVYVWIASSLLVFMDLFWRPVGGNIYRVTGWPAWIFAIVQLAGVWMIARSVRAIDPLELAGIRNPKAMNGELQTNGVYGLVRHPLYFGWVLCVFGAAHMTGDRLTFAVLTTGYLVMAMPWEERSLEREFGQSYRLYKQAVRWKILPYVY